jgi:hypothetical protein
MDMKTHEAVLKSIRETERSMRVLVKIPRDEEDRIVVNALIRVRNSEGNRNEDMRHFDKVLEHYLTANEFKKYVVEQHEIEY